MDLIVIPSAGRHTRQQTLWAFNKTGVTRTYKTVVAVPEKEAHKYKRMLYKGKRQRGEVIVVPDEYTGIDRTRQWILTKLPAIAKKKWGIDVRYLFMPDDDVRFCKRPKLSKAYMGYITHDPYEMHRMIEMLTMWLESGFVHCGLVSRQANRQLNRKWLQPSRQINVHAFDVKALAKLPIKYGRVRVMEDFDITLQLLKMGYPNRISCRYAWTQTSNMNGGCSVYRTAEVQADAARRLVKLHPDVVQIVKRKSISWQNKLIDRVDVRVRWKDALKRRKK